METPQEVANSEPYVSVESKPDELGQEWRILHPFKNSGSEIPN